MDTDFAGCEEQFLGLKEQFRALAEKLPEVVWLATADFSRMGYVSPAYETIWGEGPERICHEPGHLLETVHSDDREQIRQVFLKHDRNAPLDIRFRILRPDGTVRWIELRAWTVRAASGEVSCYAGVATDITERHLAKQELESRLQQREKEVRELERQRAANEKLAATGKMAAGIAHEINNPLAGIKNSFLLIKDAIPASHPYYEYVGRIEGEIERIAHIVRQMFDLYRPGHELPHRFHVAPAVRDVVALLESHFRQRRITAALNGVDAELEITAQEGLLRQVLYNLLANALEASPEGSVVGVDVVRRGADVLISISDQGSGIPEDLRQRIFEPFFTTKTGHRESGLGLSLTASKSMVEAMGGSIQFESRPGQGTRFDILLPAGQFARTPSERR